MDLPKLRSRLHEITSNGKIDGHPLAINNLRAEFAHTIRLVSLANPTRPQNCLEWALGLCHEMAHWVSEWKLPDLFAGSKFVQELTACLVPVSESDAAEDNLILYFDREIPTHAGLIKEAEVVSKWGKGHIYQHDQLEVPSSYGNEVRFYRKPLSTMVAMHFVKYVQDHPDYSVIQEEFVERFSHLHAE